MASKKLAVTTKEGRLVAIEGILANSLTDPTIRAALEAEKKSIVGDPHARPAIASTLDEARRQFYSSELELKSKQ